LATNQWLNIVNFGLIILIWLVQLIIYPSFHEIDEAVFTKWHKKYVKLMCSVVVPLMLAQALLVLRSVVDHLTLGNLLMLTGITICWTSSFFLSVPCHKMLQLKGKDHAVIHRLVRTNWIRTIFWTCVFLAGIMA